MADNCQDHRPGRPHEQLDRPHCVSQSPHTRRIAAGHRGSSREMATPAARWTAEAHAHEIGWNPRAFGGPHVVEYALRLADERVEALPDVTWADWDQRGRLVGAQYGRLLHWQVPGGPTVLADFNQQEPETLPPPPWAQTWPPPPK